MKSFKLFIKETPQLNSYLEKPIMKNIRKQYSDSIKQNHHKSELIDKENNFRRIKEGNYTHYYRTDSDNNPVEISSFDKENTQNHVSKGNGNSENNIKFMYLHANDVGEIRSDSSNTEGSKKLWKKIINSPKEGFSTIHQYKGKEHKIDQEYLNKNEHNIWNKSLDATNHRIILRKNK